MESEVVVTKSGVHNTFLSPSVRKLYISATKLERKYISIDEIEKYIDLKNLTLRETNIAQLLEDSLGGTVSDHNNRLLSSEKFKHKDTDFYDQSLRRLCPIFYMCHLALISSRQINKEETIEPDTGTNFLCHHNDELVSWVAEQESILGRVT